MKTIYYQITELLIFVYEDKHKSKVWFSIDNFSDPIAQIQDYLDDNGFGDETFNFELLD